MTDPDHKTYSQRIVKRYSKSKIGTCGLAIVLIFLLIALYAPFLSASKPIIVFYEGAYYFPLFRYYFSSFYFYKPLDIFYNVLGLCVPFFIWSIYTSKQVRYLFQLSIIGALFVLFIYFAFVRSLNPASDGTLNMEMQKAVAGIAKYEHDLFILKRERDPLPNWKFDLQYMNSYAKLNLVVDEYIARKQHVEVVKHLKQEDASSAHTPFWMEEENKRDRIATLKEERDKLLSMYVEDREKEVHLRHRLALIRQTNHDEKEIQKLIRYLRSLVEKNRYFERIQNQIQYYQDKDAWIEAHMKDISFVFMPLIRPLGWQDDAGGSQELNLKVPFWELTRASRQDLLAGVIYGVRVSLLVGVLATALALAIGIPLGLISGFYGGRLDVFSCRLVEVWESMPAFFMLMFLISILQTKSIFLVIAIIAIFSWTSSFRFVRAETFRQRELLYVDACHSLGYSVRRTLFVHLLPNSIIPVLALLPFDVISAITREATLAFLGLGEEQTCSWGVLMEEGSVAFPAESVLLWPPAIALTLLLVGIAFTGDTLHRAMDPKSS
jgi:peptide/nickel transport system permease protein